MQMVTLEPLMPPYSSGMGMARTPLSANSFSMSVGYSAFSSISAARGATRSCTSSRIVSRIASCSSEKLKSMRRLCGAPGRSLRSPDQVAGDHHPLDLVGALVDLQGLGVAEVPLQRLTGQRRS